jgi:hypothetical protein
MVGYENNAVMKMTVLIISLCTSQHEGKQCRSENARAYWRD